MCLLATVVYADIIELGVPYELMELGAAANPDRNVVGENYNFLQDSPIKSLDVRIEETQFGIELRKLLITWFDGS